MKVTFMEEIEARKAWFGNMYCPCCDEGLYKSHHQLEPKVSDCWWIECENCGFETTPASTREYAIARWKNGR